MIQRYSITQNVSIIDREQLLETFQQYANIPSVYLQTCNRIEVYYGNGIPDKATVTHLFRVISGLESSLVGEIAIQGQVKNAYLQAAEKHTLSKELHHLFQTALRVGKKVRNESGISKGAMSHSHAACEVILQQNISLNKAIITVIGAHKLNEDIIRFLQNKGAETIFLANKSFDKATQLAEKFNCKVMELSQLPQLLAFTDVLITATSAPHLIVHEHDFPKDKAMLILDLAFPRDVESTIGLLPQVKLYHLEDIENSIQQNINKRKDEISKAEQIIENEVDNFFLRINKTYSLDKIIE